MKKRVLVFAAAAAFLSACNSVPDPKPTDTAATNTNAAIPVPAPVTQPAPTPQPAPVVVDNSQPSIIAGPPAGSLADFHFMSGGDGRIFFSYDQATLSSEARDSLARQAQWLQIYPNVVVVIEGNADERGTREYNLALGAQRAESVKSFLVSQGVSPNRLTTVSFGKERPIDGRSTESGWARNRNAHTSLISGTIG